MSNKIELSIPELTRLNELVEQLIAKFGTPAAAQQVVAEFGAQLPANPTPAEASHSVASPVAQQTPAASSAPNPAPAIPFTAPAPAAGAPFPPVGAPNAYTSTPSQGFPSNPPAAAQPTYPPQIQQPAPAPQQPPVTTGITYTIEQISHAAAPIMQRGDGQKLADLLTGKYGVQALTLLDPKYLPAFAADIRALGAQI